MAYVEGEDRGQMALFPASIEEYIDQDSPVRVIDAFVAGLDLSKLGFSKARPAETGRPAYDPRDLLKLYLYGYFNGIRSSRALMRETQRNIELFWLLGRLQPDHRTISDFRKDNAAALRQTFLAFVRVCNKQKLYQKRLLAIDGTKLRANNAKRHAHNKPQLEDKINRIDEHIKKWMRDMDKRDAEEEDDAPGLSKQQMQELIKELSQRKGKYQDYIRQMEESGEHQLLTTDPQARLMQSKDGQHPSYNLQTAVDADSHLIADFQVTNHCNDMGLLHDVADGARKNLNVETVEVVADKGYDSNADAKNCLLDGIISQAALRYDAEERVLVLDYKPSEINEETKASEKPEDIQKCLHAGVLPDCYEDKDVHIEVQTADDSGKNLAYFVRNEDNTVTCPMGNIMTPVKRRGANTVYQNRRACHQCKHRCGRFKDYKIVQFADGTQAVPVKMPAKRDISCKLTQLPPGMEVNPGNHSLYRADSGGRRRVVIIVRCNRDKLRTRKETVEHPFGTLKRAMGFGYFLLRGIEKTTAEAALCCTAYNLKRAINMVGATNLIAAMS